MYISLDGKEILAKDDLIIDKINSFMMIDKFDIPFYHLGFVYNFSKSNVRRTINYLRILATKIIDYVADPNLSLNTIRYENGEFNIVFNYKMRQLNYSVSKND